MTVLAFPASNGIASLFARWFRRPWFLVLATVALTYALLAGLHTVSDFDLFWQMATGRWIAQHHAIFSTDIFSYSAQGQPWIYPAGSGLLFYVAFLLGGYGLICWLGALACAGTIALLLRHASAAAALLAILAVPAIATRTSPRADMLTVVLFAAFLSVLWQRYRHGTGHLWLLPPLMTAWVNLHLGFISGLAIVGLYGVSEAIRLLAVPQNRQPLKRLALWLAATYLATLMNPWGWGIYEALFRQTAAMSTHSERIAEWASISFTFASLKQAFSLRDPSSAAEWLLVAAAIAIIIALLRRQWAAALLLTGTLTLTLRHVRFMAVLACVVVVVGGEVLASEFNRLRFPDQRFKLLLASAAATLFILLAGLRSTDLVSNRYYLSGDQITSFGAGLSWWFPDRAMAFVDRERLPAQVFNTYEEGGFLLWRLGPAYSDYADGRAIPFGPDLFPRLQGLLTSPPDSPNWQQTADQYGINTVVFPLARYGGLKYVSGILPRYCESQDWRPVYLDEVSVVFVRRTPRTQALIDRFPVDCSTAPLPLTPPSADRATEFNRWANAAAVLLALDRRQEALDASTRALSVFNDCPALWYFRGRALLLTGHPAEAEHDLLQSAALEDRDSTWLVLVDLYRSQGRLLEAIHALEHLAILTPHSEAILMNLGYAYLQANRPREAIEAFDRAESALPTGTATPILAEADHCRAIARGNLGDLRTATVLEEKAVALVPQNPGYWSELARLYDLQGRSTDARRAAERATAVSGVTEPHVP